MIVTVTFQKKLGCFSYNVNGDTAATQRLAGIQSIRKKYRQYSVGSIFGEVAYSARTGLNPFDAGREIYG